MRMLRLWIIPLLFLSACENNEKAQARDDKQSKQTSDQSQSRVSTEFVGSWKLISWISNQSDGTVKHNMGENPVGLLMYDKLGNMSVHIMNSFRPIFEMGYAETSIDELKEVYEGYIAYFGKYTVDETERTITHHADGITNPGFVGAKLVRYYELSEDKLVLSTDRNKTSRLTWLRIKNRVKPDNGINGIRLE